MTENADIYLWLSIIETSAGGNSNPQNLRTARDAKVSGRKPARHYCERCIFCADIAAGGNRRRLSADADWSSDSGLRHTSGKVRIGASHYVPVLSALASRGPSARSGWSAPRPARPRLSAKPIHHVKDDAQVPAPSEGHGEGSGGRTQAAELAMAAAGDEVAVKRHSPAARVRVDRERSRRAGHRHGVVMPPWTCVASSTRAAC